MNKTLEQLDAEFEKKLAEAEDNTNEPDTTPAAEVVDDDIEEVPVVIEEEPTKEEAPVVEPEKLSKQGYAWKEMREQNKQLQEQLNNNTAMFEKYEQMAKGLGYESSAELLQRYSNEQVEKEAKEKGVDPTFYKEFKEVKDELSETKKARAEENRQRQINNFTDTLDSLITENGLSDTDKQNIIKELEQDGYTIDDIISVKSPKRLLSGYMVDIIAEKKVQNKLKANKEAFKEEKHDSSADVTTDDLEKQIADEMKEYARQNGIKF